VAGAPGVSARRLVVAVVLALAAGRAEGALPAPPFALDVTPARVSAGAPVTVTLTPQGGAGVFDVYLMWALSPEAAFLTPAGAWSPRPVAFRAGLAAAAPPVRLQWVPGPPGDIPLALVVVPAGADPLERFGWTFRPVVVPIAADPPDPGQAPDLATLAPLAVLTLLACAVVLAAGRPFLG
jgi:hypothetical protein